ncbi:MAG: Smr/MutS family protein [Paracoccaceae bacterium]
MARRRSLRPDEQELWQAVARTLRPMHAAPPTVRLDQPASPPTIRPPDPPAPLPRFRMGEKAPSARPHDLAPSLSQSLAAQPLRMDAKAFGKMTRGKLAPEARIDLHGMTLSEAHPELIRFVLNAQSAGLRLALVITGKGKQGVDTGPIPQRQGALRHQVPHWLRLPPLGQAVLQVTEAHLRHGGAGAYYVYLRRS